jgi:hypothetical protein
MLSLSFSFHLFPSPLSLYLSAKSVYIENAEKASREVLKPFSLISLLSSLLSSLNLHSVSLYALFLSIYLSLSLSVTSDCDFHFHLKLRTFFFPERLTHTQYNLLLLLLLLLSPFPSFLLDYTTASWSPARARCAAFSQGRCKIEKTKISQPPNAPLPFLSGFLAGGFGSVYVAKDDTGAEYALKKVRQARDRQNALTSRLYTASSFIPTPPPSPFPYRSRSTIKKRWTAQCGKWTLWCDGRHPQPISLCRPRSRVCGSAIDTRLKLHPPPHTHTQRQLPHHHNIVRLHASAVRPSGKHMEALLLMEYCPGEARVCLLLPLACQHLSLSSFCILDRRACG